MKRRAEPALVLVAVALLVGFLARDQRGVIVEVGGSGTGVLCQGDLELIRCGEPEVLEAVMARSIPTRRTIRAGR